MQFNLVRRCIS